MKKKKIILGVASIWTERKGLDIFKRLYETLDRGIYQIVLVGTDEKIDKALPRGIISIHRTNSKTELAKLYSLADVFVNPTREEVLGMVNVEANACGTPVITFDSGGSPECVNERSGIIVRGEDFSGMKKAIESVCAEGSFDSRECVKRAMGFSKGFISKYMKLFKVF